MTTPREVISAIESWVSHDAMKELVARFGDSWPNGDVGHVLAGLEEVSIKHWNARSRGAGERWEAPPTDFDPDVATTVIDCCRRLGLLDASTPKRDCYDAVVILGGGGDTPLIRTRHAESLVRRGIVRTRRVYLLGSPRQVGALERPRLAEYAPFARTEFDLMCAAAEHEFGVRRFIERHGSSPANSAEPFAQWTCRRYTDPSMELTALSAPSSDLERRPVTGDTYEFMYSLGEFESGDHLLIVTSAWFTAFQGFDALRLLDLAHGLETETVGFGIDEYPRPMSPSELLQEVRSGIRSARGLYEVACSMSGR